MEGHDDNETRPSEPNFSDSMFEVRPKDMGGAEEDCGVSRYNLTANGDKTASESCISANVSNLVNSIINFEPMEDEDMDRYFRDFFFDRIKSQLLIDCPNEIPPRKKRSMDEDMSLDICDNQIQDRFARCLFYAIRRDKEDIKTVVQDDDRNRMNMSERNKLLHRRKKASSKKHFVINLIYFVYMKC